MVDQWQTLDGLEISFGQGSATGLLLTGCQTMEIEILTHFCRGSSGENVAHLWLKKGFSVIVLTPTVL